MVRQATLIMIQASTTAARLPLGLGYSMRLTISQATPKIGQQRSRCSAGTAARSETTVIAPIGMGRPMKSPLLVLTQANRASRTTPASSTDRGRGQHRRERELVGEPSPRSRP